MVKINIGGVPEHFNYPWHFGIKNELFKSKGIDLDWNDYPRGTGDMCKDLRSNQLDIAIVLTEGIIKDISLGNPSKIIQTYVESSLLWGVHVSYNSNFKHIKDLKGKTAAISRMGSGSHLMTYVNAINNKWDIKSDIKFQTVNDINGGVNALSNGKADYFLWEKFTTKPYVDKKTFKSLGDCATPWPCFMIASTNQFLKKNNNVIEPLLNTINSITQSIKNIINIEQTLSKCYDLNNNDVTNWLKLTNWSQKKPSEKEIIEIQKKLMLSEIISDIAPYPELVNSL
jgi:ABC-type nitrate/sulfonate/bicarbonate transport system substrate-binding protein